MKREEDRVRGEEEEEEEVEEKKFKFSLEELREFGEEDGECDEQQRKNVLADVCNKLCMAILNSTYFFTVPTARIRVDPCVVAGNVDVLKFRTIPIMFCPSSQA